MIYVTIFFIGFIAYVSGYIDGKEGFNSGILALLLTVWVSLSINSEINSQDEGESKYDMKDVVKLPDETVGKIDSIYYKVEGKIYNQEILKNK